MRDRLVGLVASLAVVASGALLAIFIAALFEAVATPGVSRVAPIAGVAVTAIALGRPQSDAWRSGVAIGIVVGLAGILLLESVDGSFELGAGQLGAFVGAALAYPVLNKTWTSGWTIGEVARWVLLGLGLIVAVALVRVVIDGGALGHDESAYAVKARFWLEGTPDTGWQVHRAPALSVLGVPVLLFSESEVAFRSVSVLLSVVALSAVALVGHRLGGVWAGAVAAATVAASLPFLRRGSEYLTDVPAAGLLLLAVGVVVVVFADESNDGRALIWLGPVVAAAFYMRYQSALSFVGIALGVLVAWPHRIRTLRRPIVRGAILLGVLLIPHWVWATIAYGSPWAVVLDTSGRGGREFLGEGLLDYARMFWKDLAGPMGAAAMILAGVWILLTLGRWLLTSKRDGDARVAAFVAVTVVVAVVPLGLISHGEPRFVFFPVWLLISLAAMVGIRLLARLPRRWILAAAAVIVLGWLPVFGETLRRADRNAEARGRNFQVIVDASDLIATEAADSCGVMTTYEPQVNWYSACSTGPFRPQRPDLGLDSLAGEAEYVLLFENGKREPQGPDRAKYEQLGPQTTVPAQTSGIGDATVIRVG